MPPSVNSPNNIILDRGFFISSSITRCKGLAPSLASNPFFIKNSIASSVALTSTSFSIVIVFNSNKNFLTTDFMVSLPNLSNFITASNLFLNSGGKNFFIALSSSPVLSLLPNPMLFLSFSSAPKLDVIINVMFLQSAFLPLDPVTVP